MRSWTLRSSLALAAALSVSVAADYEINTDDVRIPDHVIIYVLTGQSNALGTANDPATSDDPGIGEHPADSRIPFYWANRSTRGGDDEAALIGHAEGAIRVLQAQQGEGDHPVFWGPEVNFARTLWDEGERDFMIIKASRGGGGNSFWLKDSENDHMYRHVVATVNDAVALLPEGTRYEIRGLLFMQGESDSGEEIEQAGQRAVTLLDNLREDLPNATDMHMVIGGVAATRGEQSAENQAAAAEADDRITFVDNTDLREHLYDDLHFDKEGKLIVGERMAEAWLELVGPAEDWVPSRITPLADTPWMGARFDPVSCGERHEADRRAARDAGWPRDGVIVTSVAAGSPAAEAGIAPGDFITRIEREDVETLSGLIAALESLEELERVTIRWEHREVDDRNRVRYNRQTERLDLIRYQDYIHQAFIVRENDDGSSYLVHNQTPQREMFENGVAIACMPVISFDPDDTMRLWFQVNTTSPEDLSEIRFSHNGTTLSYTVQDVHRLPERQRVVIPIEGELAQLLLNMGIAQAGSITAQGLRPANQAVDADGWAVWGDTLEAWRLAHE